MSGDSFDSRRGRGLDDVFFDDDEGGYGVDALRASLPTPRRGGGGASLGGFTGGVPPPGGPGPGAAQRAAMERALAARASSAAAPPLGRPPGQGQPAGAAGEAQRAAMRRALAARAAAAPPLEADRFLSDPSSAAAEPVDSGEFLRPRAVDAGFYGGGVPTAGAAAPRSFMEMEGEGRPERRRGGPTAGRRGRELDEGSFSGGDRRGARRGGSVRSMSHWEGRSPPRSVAFHESRSLASSREGDRGGFGLERRAPSSANRSVELHEEELAGDRGESPGRASSVDSTGTRGTREGYEAEGRGTHGGAASRGSSRTGGTRRGPPRDRARASSPAPPPRDEARVSLFEYGGVESEICGGICGSRMKICVSRACGYGHAIKAFADMPAGAYIRCPPSRQAGSTVWRNPFLTRAEAEGSPAFEEARGATLPVATFVRLFETIKAGTSEEVGKGDVADFLAGETRKDPPTSPFKRTKLTKVESGASPSNEERWAAAEEAINQGVRRLARMEGQVGTPSGGAATLWQGHGNLEDRVRGCEKGLKGVPAALDASNIAADIAREARKAAHAFAANNNSRALVGSVERRQDELEEHMEALQASNADLRDKNADLLATMEATNAVMLQLLAEPKGAAAPAVPVASGISRAEFGSYKAQKEYDLSVLVQSLKGGGYEIGLDTFTVEQDARDWCAANTDPGLRLFENFVGFMALLQMTRPAVVTQRSVEGEQLHAAKVDLNQRQTATVASFQTTYPEAFGVPGKGEEEVDFVLMKTYAAWNAGDGRTGLRHVLTKGLREQKQSLQAHQKVHLEGHAAALTLAAQTLADVTAWFTWFCTALEEHYTTLLTRAAPSGTYTKSLKASCWKRTTAALRIFFEECRVARVHASGAHYFATPLKQNAAFLHGTLQELRVMREFQTAGFGGHKLVKDGLLDHIYESYVSRDSVADASDALKTAAAEATAAKKAIAHLRTEFNAYKAKHP